MEPAPRHRLTKGFFAAETGTAALLGLAFGAVMLDRGAIGFLSPFFVGELHLSHAQLGVAASATSLTWALAAFPAARAADRSGRHKSFLVAAILCFTLISALCGLAAGFLSLLAIRLGLGLAEGPVPPLVAAFLLGSSSDHRRGFNMGILTVCKTLVGNLLAPLMLVGLASHFGWRPTFWLIALPGLAIAAAVALWLRDEPVRRTSRVEAPIPVRDLLHNRNIVICAGLGIQMIAFVVLTTVFLPLYLVKVRHLSPIEMGLVMAAFGASNLVGAFLVPTLSDRLGRRRVVAMFAACGVALPLGCLYWTGGVLGLAAICALAALPGGLPHVVIGMIPGESVAPRNRASANAIVSGIGELIGGFATPSLAGLLADKAGLGAVMVLGGVCAGGASLLALCLSETAPRFGRQPVAMQPVLEGA